MLLWWLHSVNTDAAMVTLSCLHTPTWYVAINHWVDPINISCRDFSCVRVRGCNQAEVVALWSLLCSSLPALPFFVVDERWGCYWGFCPYLSLPPLSDEHSLRCGKQYFDWRRQLPIVMDFSFLCKRMYTRVCVCTFLHSCVWSYVCVCLRACLPVLVHMLERGWSICQPGFSH